MFLQNISKQILSKWKLYIEIKILKFFFLLTLLRCLVQVHDKMFYSNNERCLVLVCLWWLFLKMDNRNWSKVFIASKNERSRRINQCSIRLAAVLIGWEVLCLQICVWTHRLNTFPCLCCSEDIHFLWGQEMFFFASIWDIFHSSSYFLHKKHKENSALFYMSIVLWWTGKPRLCPSVAGLAPATPWPRTEQGFITATYFWKACNSIYRFFVHI